jgi:hypothetical protein
MIIVTILEKDKHSENIKALQFLLTMFLGHEGKNFQGRSHAEQIDF